MAGEFGGTYAADQVTITVGGIILSGYADGDFVTASYDEPRYAKHAGADGEVGRAKNPSRAGRFEFTLSSSSKANDQLTALANLESLAGVDPTFPIGVVDLSGRTVLAASVCWLAETPEITFGKEIGERTWIFDCADLVMVAGGSNV